MNICRRFKVSISNEHRKLIVNEMIEEIGKNTYNKSFSPTDFALSHGLTVQSVYRYLKKLEFEQIILKYKHGKTNQYKLIDTAYHFSYTIGTFSEDSVWNNAISSLMNDFSEVVYANSSYAVSEMLNNAIEHSEGNIVDVQVFINPFRIAFLITDDGVGIFTKIASALQLEEKRFSILELAKGKFTTAPNSHSGEGIFFSSKVSDVFAIFSDNLVFSALNMDEYEDGRLRDFAGTNQVGTTVFIEIFRNHSISSKEVFDKYTQFPDHYGFTKTIVPVKLLEYGNTRPIFVSRSQAKRLLVRFERFERIELDFSGVNEIGQGFADEVFRVFKNQHPNSKIIAINYNQDIMKMIKHVEGDIE